VRGLLIAVSLVAGIVVPAAGAQAARGIGIRLVGVSGESTNNPRARWYFTDRLPPGTTIQRRIEISNSTSSTATVAVYPAAATLRGGTFRFATGHQRNDLSSWTSVSRELLRLPPRSRAFETVTITVPEDASSGERYAVVWAEVSAPAPVTGGVTLVNRVGVRMYVSIGPGGGRPSSFTIGSLTAQRSASGQPLVSAKVRNSGQRTLDIRGTLMLSHGPGGLRAGPLPVKLGAGLAPGDSEILTVPLDESVPRGPWRADLTLTSGLIHRAAGATITFPAVAQKPPSGAVAQEGADRMMLVILLGLLAVAGVALWLSRHTHRGTRRR
jgi:hypothetical protein